jgi:hypothetical protein
VTSLLHSKQPCHNATLTKLITTGFMLRNVRSLHVKCSLFWFLTKIWMCQQIFVKLLNIKFNENLPSSSQTLTCRLINMLNLIGTCSIKQFFIISLWEELVMPHSLSYLSEGTVTEHAKFEMQFCLVANIYSMLAKWAYMLQLLYQNFKTETISLIFHFPSLQPTLASDNIHSKY